MGEHCHQPHEPGAFIDSRCLDGGDLMPAEAFAHEVEPARQRRIAKAPTPFGIMPGSVPTSDFAVGELELCFCKSRRDGADVLARAMHDPSPPRGGRS